MDRARVIQQSSSKSEKSKQHTRAGDEVTLFRLRVAEVQAPPVEHMQCFICVLYAARHLEIQSTQQDSELLGISICIAA